MIATLLIERIHGPVFSMTVKSTQESIELRTADKSTRMSDGDILLGTFQCSGVVGRSCLNFECIRGTFPYWWTSAMVKHHHSYGNNFLAVIVSLHPVRSACRLRHVSYTSALVPSPWWCT
jgi:hypothetical protein